MKRLTHVVLIVAFSIPAGNVFGFVQSAAPNTGTCRQREFTGHLRGYYEEVTAAIRDAESILIFGPGEAKGELKNLLEKDNLGGRIVAVETVDKMTDRQIAAKVRGYFLK